MSVGQDNMQKQAIINAGSAVLYIMLVAAVMTWGEKMTPREDTFLAPIAFLSLFTLSAAVMAFLFGYGPLQLILENKKKQAVSLLLQTIAIFGGITAVLLGLVFGGF